MGWLVALLVAAIAFFLLQRERRESEEKLRTMAKWTAELLKTGTFPSKGPIPNPAQAIIASDLERIGGEMERTRRDLTTEAASLQTILSSMAEGVMVVDSRHIIRRVNPSLLRTFNLSAECIGRSMLQTLRETRVDEIVTGAFATGEVQTCDVSLNQFKGSRHLALAATRIREVTGDQAVLLISHDVTRLRQLEDVRREFVANVSHELRTPLAIFQGYIENLLDQPDLPRPDLVNVLQILKRHSTRLNALVEDLLVLARLESRVEGLHLEQIDPRVLVETVVRDWQIAASKRQITLSAECAPGTPHFAADGLRIEQVFHNLVDNAIKHTGQGGTITLRAAPYAGGIEFRIEDTGIGISPQDLPRIFERFYRADKARSREQGGTGLGLSIVKHIVQLHGGTAHAESTLGKGTCMILQLPLRPVAKRDVSTSDSESEAPYAAVTA